MSGHAIGQCRDFFSGAASKIQQQDSLLPMRHEPDAFHKLLLLVQPVCRIASCIRERAQFTAEVRPTQAADLHLDGVRTALRGSLDVMIHEIFPVGPLQCNCSVVGDEQTKEAIVIDPGDEIDNVMAVVQRHGLTVKQIVVTHAHIDHVGGAMKLKRLTGAPVLLNQNDYALLKMLDVQAAWIGMRSPGNGDHRCQSHHRRQGQRRQPDRRRTAHPGPHRGQHLPLFRAGEKADCR